MNAATASAYVDTGEKGALPDFGPTVLDPQRLKTLGA
jgi:hypothetical protein